MTQTRTCTCPNCGTEFVIDATFNPDMLTLARDIRGMTTADVSKKTRIKMGVLDRYINGLKEPPLDDVRKLGKALDYPESFFYRVGKRRPLQFPMHSAYNDWINS